MKQTKSSPNNPKELGHRSTSVLHLTSVYKYLIHAEMLWSYIVMKDMTYIVWIITGHNSTMNIKGVRKWLNAIVYVSVISRLVVHPTSVCFDNSLAICVSLTCSHQCHRLVRQRLCHVLSCLCDNTCKRSLVICRESRQFCPGSRLLSLPV